MSGYPKTTRERGGAANRYRSERGRTPVSLRHDATRLGVGVTVCGAFQAKGPLP